MIIDHPQGQRSAHVHWHSLALIEHTVTDCEDYFHLDKSMKMFQSNATQQTPFPL